MFVGRATLRLAGVAVDVQATLYGRLDPVSGLTAWDGWFSILTPTTAQPFLDALADTDRVVELQIDCDLESSLAVVTRIVDDHGELDGVGPPPARVAS